MNMQKTRYSVVALDMDGTLLNSDHDTTPYTREVIRRAGNAGKVVALATGRCLSELEDHVRELRAVRYLICENGACVYDAQARRSISRLSIEQEKVEHIIEMSARYDAVVQFFMEDQSYLACDRCMDLTPYHIEEYRKVFEGGSIFDGQLFAHYRAQRRVVDKINFYFSTMEGRAAMRAELDGYGLAMVNSIGIGLELSPLDASKGRGLERLCAHLNVPLEESMAVGDGGNDLEIMRTAGLAVAMGNAIPEVVALADAVTDDCDHDGAAKAIERFMLV